MLENGDKTYNQIRVIEEQDKNTIVSNNFVIEHDKNSECLTISSNIDIVLNFEKSIGLNVNGDLDITTTGDTNIYSNNINMDSNKGKIFINSGKAKQIKQYFKGIWESIKCLE